MKTTIDRLKIQGIDILPLIKAVANSFVPDPGTSDLDDEQPCYIEIPLGEYRRAVRLLHELDRPEPEVTTWEYHDIHQIPSPNCHLCKGATR